VAKSPPEPVTAVWLRHLGDQAQVLVEVNGQWRLIIEEFHEGPFSHIAEARSFRARPVDPVSGG